MALFEQNQVRFEKYYENLAKIVFYGELFKRTR